MLLPPHNESVANAAVTRTFFKLAICKFQVANMGQIDSTKFERRFHAPMTTSSFLGTNALTCVQWFPDLLSWRTCKDLQGCLGCERITAGEPVEDDLCTLRAANIPRYCKGRASSAMATVGTYTIEAHPRSKWNEPHRDLNAWPLQTWPLCPSDFKRRLLIISTSRWS